MSSNPSSKPIRNLKSETACFCLNQLRLRLFNAQSVCNKLAELEVLLLSGEADIICVTETWLTDSYPDSLLSCSGAFQVVRADRTGRGGGVLLLIRKGIPFVSVEISVVIEAVAVDLVSEVGQYRLLVAYLPPRLDLPVINSACAELSRLLDVSFPVIILGDFNFPEIAWQDCHRPQGQVAQHFFEFTVTTGLQQLVMQPTRNDALLDLVLCTHAETVLRTIVIEPFSCSDHNAVDIAIAWNDPTVIKETYNDFRNANWVSIRAYLGTVDWAYELGYCATVQQCWDNIYTHLLRAILHFVPRRTYSSELDPLPLYLRRLRSKRRRLFRCRKNSALAAARAKSFNLYYRRKLWNFCERREQKVLSGNSLHALYSFIRRKTKLRCAIPNLQTDSEDFQTDAAKAELFNDFFASVYTRDRGTVPGFADKGFHTPLNSVDINVTIVSKVLSKMPSKYSCGPDGIPSIFYKQCQNVLAFPLSILFARSLATAEIPEIWKRTVVVPVYKKGNRSLPTNYRPVSLSCAIMLAFERCLKPSMVKHLEINKLLSDKQYGFRAGRSVEVQLLSTLNEWTLALDKGYCIDAIYTDFAKAFDTVSHSKLLIKLWGFGFRGILYDWLRSYLSGRKQLVKIGSKVSGWTDVVSGVPQGSVLGPLLFLIFIDDLVAVLPADVRVMLYADDAKLYYIYPPTGWTPILQAALVVLQEWTVAWDLRLAIAKCVAIYFGRVNSKHSYNLLGQELDLVTTVRDLGVTVLEDLTWYSHIANIVAKASRCAQAIVKSFHYVNLELLAKAFTVYVRPILEAASVVWSPYLKQDKMLLESVQRAYSKRIFKKCGFVNASYEDRLGLLGWSKLEDRRNHADLTLLFRILKGSAEGVETLFNLSENVYQLRGNQSRLMSTRSRLDIRKYFYMNRVIDAWNGLALDIMQIRNVRQFTSVLQNMD